MNFLKGKFFWSNPRDFRLQGTIGEVIEVYGEFIFVSYVRPDKIVVQRLEPIDNATYYAFCSDYESCVTLRDQFEANKRTAQAGK